MEHRATRSEGEAPHDRAHYRELADRNYRLNLDEIRSGQTTLASFPPNLQIDLIGICNMTPPCPMCPIDAASPYAHAGASLRHFVELGPFLDNCQQLTNCSTGEPLLHPDLLPLLRLSRDRGKRLGFSSNALSLTPDLAERILELGDAVSVVFSLDAATERTYRKVRGLGWREVKENIRRFVELAARRTPGQRPRVGLCFIPMRCNRREMARFVAMAADLGVDYVEVRPLVDLPGKLPLRHHGFLFDYHAQMLTRGELSRLARKAYRAGRRHHIAINWQHEIDDENPYPLFRPRELPPLRTPCAMPWTFILPFQNGDTMPCCYIRKSMGNWREHGLEGVWNGKAWVRLRTTLARGELAAECLESPSCPIVRHRLRSSIGAADPGNGQATEWRCAVWDEGFDQRVLDGVYALEGPDGAGVTYRWLGARARLRLLRPWAGRPLQIGLRMLSGSPTGSSTVRVKVGSRARAWRLDAGIWNTIWLPVPRGDGPFDVGIDCADPWMPAARGPSSDRRTLGVMLSEIVLRSGPPPDPAGLIPRLTRLLRWMPLCAPSSSPGR